MVEPYSEKIVICENKPDINGQIKTECKSEVQSENVEKILCVTPFLTLKEQKPLEKKIEYGGKITYYISYIDKDKNIKKCECGNEFKGELNGEVNADSKIKVLFRNEKTTVNIDGMYLTVSSIININGKIKDCHTVEVLTGGENLAVKDTDINIEKVVGECKGEYPLEEEFTLPFPVEEVLYQKIKGIITAVQCGVGSVIVDGEILFSGIMLQNNDKRDIIKEDKIFPYRMEMECEEAMPSMSAIANVMEKTLKSDISVDSESEKSVVKVSARLSFDGSVFADENITIAEDVFSTESQLELTSDKVEFSCSGDIRSFNDKIYLRSVTEELPVGVKLISVANENVVITENKINDGKLILSGVIDATCFFTDDSQLFTRIVEIPFEKDFDGKFPDEIILAPVVNVGRTNGRVVSLNELELETELFVTLYPQEKRSYKVIKSLKVTGEKKQDDTAISVFIPYSGEELWSLAKRLNVCPEELVNTNKELNFPLTGEERIVVYRQK